MRTTRLATGITAALILAGSLTISSRAATVTLAPMEQSTSMSVTRTCSTPSRTASLAEPVFVDIPPIAQAQNVSGVTKLAIDLSASGNLVSENLIESSGNAALDDEALRSARLAPFSPEIRNCERVAGSYLYIVDFTR